jgi:hypothetical protein
MLDEGRVVVTRYIKHCKLFYQTTKRHIVIEVQCRCVFERRIVGDSVEGVLARVKAACVVARRNAAP